VASFIGAAAGAQALKALPEPKIKAEPPKDPYRGADLTPEPAPDPGPSIFVGSKAPPIGARAGDIYLRDDGLGGTLYVYQGTEWHAISHRPEVA